MGKSLSESLSHFISSATEDDFADPFTESVVDSEQLARDVMERAADRRQQKKQKAKKRDKITDTLNQGDQLLNKLSDDQLVDDFDGFLDHFFLDDEDTAMKQTLVSYGRQYARDTKSSAESSEVSKMYAKHEEELGHLLSEVEADSQSLQKDISSLRMARSRNFKALSDMVDAKNQQHNTRLQIIKELNNMKKTQFDLQMKISKQKKEDEADNSVASRAVQQLFGMGRENLMGAIGGYGGVSGADEAGRGADGYEEIAMDDTDEDEIIQKRYFNDSSEPETDGDKYIKYEGMGVHFVLLYDEDDDSYREIIAEDKDGNLIPDYPLPNPDDLDFELSVSTGTATDNLAQSYELRKV